MRTLLLYAVLGSATALAQTSHTWVSGVGDDANPCSRTAPCKTLAGTLSHTANGGEVSLLDEAALGAATITQSVTISADTQLGGVDSPTVDALTIAAPGSSVTLRGLRFRAVASGTSGLVISAAHAVRLVDCRFTGFTSDTVVVQAGAFFADRLHVDGALGAAIKVASTSGAALNATLRDTALVHADAGLFAGPGALVTLQDVVLEGDETGIQTSASSSCEVNVEGGALSHNGFGVTAESGAVVRLSDATLLDESLSVTHVRGSGVVHSFGNNRIVGGSTPGCIGVTALEVAQLPDASVVGVPLPDVLLGATGVLGELTWAISGGPAGVGLDGGVFGGTPTELGAFTATLGATDSNQCAAQATFTWNVVCPELSLSPLSATLLTGTPVSVPFVLSGSTSDSLTLTVSGVLPIGVSVVDGGLGGLATQPGTFPLTVAATDGFGCSAQAPFTLEVQPSADFQPTSLTLSATEPAVFTAPVTLTATLGFDAGTPSGSVRFLEGTDELGRADVVGGFAVFSTQLLALGDHALHAEYLGDATFGASVSPEVTVTVVKAATETTVRFLTDTLVVQVTSTLATPDGEVSVVVDDGPPVMAALDTSGTARVAAPLSVGTHTASASYPGASRFEASASQPISYVVNAPEPDAGRPVADAGQADAGDGATPPTGCGCTSAPAGSFLALLAGLAFVLRRRR